MHGESFEFDLDKETSEDYEGAWEAAAGQNADLHAQWEERYGSRFNNFPVSKGIIGGLI